MNHIIITFSLLFASHSALAAQSDADIFFNLYGEMIRSVTLSEYIGFFDSKLDEKSKEFFVERCGWKCRLGLSSKWKRKYLSSHNYDLYRKRQVQSFTGYSTEKIKDGFVIHLAFKSITKTSGDITYSVVFEEGRSKISHVLFSDKDFGPYKDVQHINLDQKEIDCMKEVRSLDKEEAIKEHWKCF
jgi:hypothetical protein